MIGGVFAVVLSETILKYHIPWTTLDWPLDWGQIFGRSGDLVVEIGFGNGGFLVDQAGQHPERLFVGIERTWTSITRLFKGLAAGGLDNVRAMEIDAAFALSHLFGPRSICEVFINFPDPWHKERHHGRRLIRPAFIQTLAERLRPGGTVTIATDQAEYAEWIAGVLTKQTQLRPVYETPFVSHLPGRQPTKYEKKAIAAGVPIHYFVWQQDAEGTADVQVERVGEMPNVILKGDCDRTHLLVDFTPQVWQETYRDVPVVIKFMEVYSQLQEGHGLVTAMVREGALVQYFGISVVLRKNNRLLVKLASFGQPRPTWGVKLAVKKAAEWLQEKHPGLEVVSSTV